MARERTKLITALHRTFVAACSVALVVGFVFAVYFYSTTRLRIERDAMVTNLTAAGFTARVGIVDGPGCDAPGPQCWTDPRFDDSAWPSMRIPLSASTPVQALEGYSKASGGSLIVYRMMVPVDEKLLGIDEEISFTPVYVTHTRYSVYVNGRLVQTSNGVETLGATLNVALPRQDIVDGLVNVTIVGSHEKILPGLASRASAYVGPKPLLDEIYIHAERVGGTFHLLFLLTKGGIFVVFALFFIFSRGQRGLFSFLVFSLFVSVENVLLGDFFAGRISFHYAEVIVVMTKVVAINALFAYLTEFYEVHRRRRWMRGLAVASFTVFAPLVYDYAWGSHTVGSDVLLKTTNAFLVTAIVLGLAGGAITYRMWRREGFADEAVRSLRNLAIFLAIYLGLLIWEFGFNAYYGFDKRPLFDLLLFYYMAFITARDFGLKEGQVRTLEAHMIEKRRMEAELQEAAEIAKAFLPGSLPQWDELTIRSHHRSLTENSGDWYTFERARSRRLYHFLMCDVTGHGVQAAIVVSACKSVLSLLTRNQPDLLETPDFASHYACALNDVLFTQGDGHHLTTLLALTFDADAGVVHYGAGGHPPPLLVGTPGGARPVINALVTRNTVLGSQPNVAFKLASRALAAGESVIAYTDGLPLSPNVKVLREFLAQDSGLSPNDALHRLYLKVWEAHTARTGQAPDDDVSIVCFSYQPHLEADSSLTGT